MKAIFENKRDIPIFTKSKKHRVKSMLQLGKNQKNKIKNSSYSIKQHKTTLSGYLK